MAMYLRPPKDEIGKGSRATGAFRFITSAPLVMHDRCADDLGVLGHPWDDGREAFSALAGQDLCWSPVWSMDANAAPCYCCGSPVVGRG